MISTTIDMTTATAVALCVLPGTQAETTIIRQPRLRSAVAAVQGTTLPVAAKAGSFVSGALATNGAFSGVRGAVSYDAPALCVARSHNGRPPV